MSNFIYRIQPSIKKLIKFQSTNNKKDNEETSKKNLSQSTNVNTKKNDFLSRIKFFEQKNAIPKNKPVEIKKLKTLQENKSIFKKNLEEKNENKILNKDKPKDKSTNKIIEKINKNEIIKEEEEQK